MPASDHTILHEPAPPYNELEVPSIGSSPGLRTNPPSPNTTHSSLPNGPNPGSTTASATSNNTLIRTRSGLRLEYNPSASSATAESSNAVASSSQAQLSFISATPTPTLEIQNSLLNSGGASIPLTREERTQFDRKALKRWEEGPYLFLMPNRTGDDHDPFRKYTFDASALYTSAISQLEMLLPHLSPPGTLPSQTTKRTITLRLPLFPEPTGMWRNTNLKCPAVTAKLVREFQEIDKMFTGVVWNKHSKDKVVGVVLDVMECIVARCVMEGFVVLEDLWYPRLKVAQIILLC
ncbi:hypothetical protein SISNIDRAFT_550838 [Sistotremastrum niveocremeum HHB9708]|uniref:Uncharacterized protein n=1 Tax=Sistotremastrum niveocremeum HHB9708 TaxID=1314777 RepID=A0A164SU66_9AGAM|nr:hypothetical protein SISNIDRAFT_550838 [Sistotremastrum niveocremeum HHB9708]